MECCTRYRAELLSILTSLITLYQTHVTAESLTGTIHMECGHKRVLREAFRNCPLGVKTAVQPNYDIIMEIRHLRSRMGISIIPVHNPWSQTTPHQQPNSDNFQNPQQKSHRHSTQMQIPSLVKIAPFTHTVTVLKDGSPIFNNLRTTVNKTLHKEALRDKILKDNKWSKEQFDMVAWASYDSAT
jgi:hypothetical protein